MELLLALAVVATLAILGAAAEAFGADSRPVTERGDKNAWI